MGIFNLFRRNKVALSAPQQLTVSVGGVDPLDSVRDFFKDCLLGEQAIMGYPACRRPVELIAGMLATTPINCYHRERNDSREKELDNKAYQLLMVRPNSWQTPVVFKKQLAYYRLIYQNAYALILRDEWGTPLELLPLHPYDCYPRVLDGELVYSVALNRWTTPDAPPEFTFRLVRPTEIIHLRGIGTAIAGDALLHVAKKSLHLSLNLQTFSCNFFDNGTSGYRFVEMPAACKTETDRRQFVKEFRQSYEGARNASRTVFVPFGAKVTTDQIDSDQQMMLSTQEADLLNCANLFGIPGVFLGCRTNSSYKSMEHETRVLLRSISTHLVEWEQEFEAKLLTERDKSTARRQLTFDRSALVDIDQKESTDDLIAQYNNGLRSWKETRQRMNLTTERDEAEHWVRPSTIVSDDDEPEDPKPVATLPPELPLQPEEDEAVNETVQQMAAAIVKRLKVRLQKECERKQPDFDKERGICLDQLSPLPNSVKMVNDLFDELNAVLPEQRGSVIDKLNNSFVRGLCKL